MNLRISIWKSLKLEFWNAISRDIPRALSTLFHRQRIIIWAAVFFPLIFCSPELQVSHAMPQRKGWDILHAFSDLSPPRKLALRLQRETLVSSRVSAPFPSSCCVCAWRVQDQQVYCWSQITRVTRYSNSEGKSSGGHSETGNRTPPMTWENRVMKAEKNETPEIGVYLFFSFCHFPPLRNKMDRFFPDRNNLIWCLWCFFFNLFLLNIWALQGKQRHGKLSFLHCEEKEKV